MINLTNSAAELWQGASNPLASHYQKFKVEQQLRFTGHSHQAWPDCSWQGQQQAWLDAAQFADAKWEAAQHQADLVRAGFSRLIGIDTDINLGANTHELLVRFLSALPLREKPKLITTEQELHSMRRQLDSLALWGLDVVKVNLWPRHNFAQRLVDEVDERTAAVLCSWVAFEDSAIVPLEDLCTQITNKGAEFLVDVYHGLNVVPLAAQALQLDKAFLLGGGYKYCQLGEGNCFLSVPKDNTLRPVITGWYSEFADLTEVSQHGLSYGQGPERFAGSTYDPSSHYRAARVFDFFQQQQLTPDLLREINQQQINYVVTALRQQAEFTRRWQVPEIAELASHGGFVAIRGEQANRLYEYLQSKQVFVDLRGQALRIGPAPYHNQHQLDQLVLHLLEFT